MKEKKNSTIIAVVIVAVMIAAMFGYRALTAGNEPASQQGAKNKTQELKDFTMLDENGEEVKLSDKIGKPMIVNFWATWCPPCQNEMPHLQDAYEQYGDKVEFVMVDLVDGQSEDMENGKKFAEDNGYTFPLYFDENREGSTAYNVAYIPYTVVVDKEGRIVGTHNGEMKKADVEEYINRILDEGE